MKALHRRLQTVARALATLSGRIAAIALFIMATGVTVDILERYFLGRSTQMAVEVSGYLLVAIVFLGLSYTQINNAHIKIELLLNILPKPMRKAINAFNLVAFLVYCTILVGLGIRSVLTSYRFKSTSRTSLDITIWPIQLVIPVGLIILILVLLFFGSKSDKTPPPGNLND